MSRQCCIYLSMSKKKKKKKKIEQDLVERKSHYQNWRFRTSTTPFYITVVSNQENKRA